MLGHAPSKKEIPTLNQNDIPYESATDKTNLFAENLSKVSSIDNYSSQFLWIGIIIECFQSFGISCKNHILLINNKNILSVFSDKCLSIL
jgi:hypothetical protein